MVLWFVHVIRDSFGKLWFIFPRGVEVELGSRVEVVPGFIFPRGVYQGKLEKGWDRDEFHDAVDNLEDMIIKWI